jgi:hypothetical protein
MALTPGSDVDFKFLVSNGGDKCLNSGARPTAKPSFGFQSGVVEAIVQLSIGVGRSPHRHNAISGTLFGITSSASVAATT